MVESRPWDDTDRKNCTKVDVKMIEQRAKRPQSDANPTVWEIIPISGDSARWNQVIMILQWIVASYTNILMLLPVGVSGRCQMAEMVELELMTAGCKIDILNLAIGRHRSALLMGSHAVVTTGEISPGDNNPSRKIS